MATTTPTTNSAPIRTASQPLRVPPDDTIWKRYSPHHEAPLSFIGSFAAHVLVLALILIYAFVVVLWWHSEPQSLPITTIHMPSGGGGNPKGQAGGQGLGNPQENVGDSGNDSVSNDDPVSRPPLDVEETQAVRVEFKDDPAVTRFIEDGNEALKKIARLNPEARDKLREGVNPAPQGKGGTGSGGGKGSGEGTGDGAGKGDGRILNEREKRMLRWTMAFNTRDGMDYLAQLRDLGAIIAIPVGGDGKHYQSCDLTKPPYRFTDQDLSELKRIYWVDDKPTSVRSLMSALGVRLAPSHFVAFMPQELEARLFDLELKFAGRPEDQIYETTFKCVRGAGGKYDVIVMGQKPK